MSSASSPVRAVLEDYVAGRLRAERVVEAVAAAYYGGEGGRGTRDGLKALMEIIERAHPGIVELAGTNDKPGFGVRLAERPFPKEFEPALRAAVEVALAGAASVGAQHAAPLRTPNSGFVARLVVAIRRLFSASA